jgi:hypothetical protein
MMTAEPQVADDLDNVSVVDELKIQCVLRILCTVGCGSIKISCSSAALMLLLKVRSLEGAIARTLSRTGDIREYLARICRNQV